jgi:hypothetical protein
MTDLLQPIEGNPFRRSQDFESVYANNVQFESTVFDLSVLFGSIEREAGKLFIEQHTSVTMAWPEAKLAAIFLAINVANHEKAYGTIKIPKEVIPSFLKPEDAELSLEDIFRAVVGRYDEIKKPSEAEPPIEPE